MGRVRQVASGSSGAMSGVSWAGGVSAVRGTGCVNFPPCGRNEHITKISHSVLIRMQSAYNELPSAGK